MTEIAIYMNSAGHQDRMAQMIEQGAAKHGIKSVRFSGRPSPTKIVACWGWRIGKVFRDAGHEVLVFERGYIGDRMHWTSIGWNGLNGHADFCNPPAERSRFDKHFRLLPWRREYKPMFVLCGQIPGDASLGGTDLTKWYQDTAAELQVAHPGCEVYFKPHPAGLGDPRRNFRPKIPKFSGDMNDACDMAQAIICWNSNSAVDAVIRGCPALTYDKGAMAYEVTGHDVEDIIMPDREDWAARLAWCQWSPDEIAQGAFWERMLCKVAA